MVTNNFRILVSKDPVTEDYTRTGVTVQADSLQDAQAQAEALYNRWNGVQGSTRVYVLVERDMGKHA